MHNNFLRLGLVGMNNWADILILQYEDGRKVLKGMSNELGNSDLDNSDKTHINSMLSEMSFVIDWLKSGKEPGKIRGIEKNSIYQVNSMDDMDLFPSLQIKPTERELTEDEKQLVYDALRDLSPRERQAFIFREAYLWSYKDISNELGVAISTVQSYLERAKEKLSCRKNAITA
ncbi:hypothetical protein Pryu01_03048 [Paraliobacillus ryukyuensis]|uniref:RNA polymerase sigma-70 factor (ECF subfamily) n=2 Tax=Paraliobacillus ryukyuensis TaxID=200904 RepID=A0A366DS32_9BACI|nr:RNA polymerase sigma-70 factor (ECF subfamily) [Paraliobacillus ryukyuensis]